MVTIGPKRRIKWNYHDMAEAGIRVLLLLFFMELEMRDPFVRKIQPEEVWLYRNPMTKSYIPGHILWKMVTFVPLVAVLVAFFSRRCMSDLRAAMLAATLTIPLNGVITNIMKLCVGRFRPDFVFRCWPDGNIPANAFDSDFLECTGDARIIAEGRKSFPSGHSSFSFAAWGFVFLYFSGKVGTFHCRRESGSWKLLVSLSLLFAPLSIAMSRTADYHHHWQDVVVGSMIGLAVACVVYRQYYPSIFSPESAVPLSLVPTNHNVNNNNSPDRDSYKPLIQQQV